MSDEKLNALSDATLRKIDHLIAQITDALTDLTFNKHIFRHQVLIGLTLSVLERAHSTVFLVKNGKAYDAQIIFRSMMEHLAELMNCVDDPGYHLNFELPFLDATKRQLTQAEAGNPFFHLIAQNIDIETERANVERKIQEIENRGGKRPNSQAKFHKAGLHHEYESLFRSTSSQVHPSFSGLIGRHFKVNKDTGTIEHIALFARPHQLTEEALAQTTTETLEILLGLMDKIARETSEHPDAKQ